MVLGAGKRERERELTYTLVTQGDINFLLLSLIITKVLRIYKIQNLSFLNLLINLSLVSVCVTSLKVIVSFLQKQRMT